VNVPGQYLKTVGDFLFRPRHFFDHRDLDRDSYVGPLPFVVVSIALAGVVGTLTHEVAELSEPKLTRLDATLIIGAIAVAHCVIAVAIGKIAGLLLNERTDVTDLLAAFCFTSVFYVPLAVCLALAPATLTNPDVANVLATTIVQLVAVAYLITSMARACALHGRRLLAFGTLSGTMVLLVAVATTAALIWFRPELFRSPYSALRASVQIRSNGAIGAITVGHFSVTATSVRLIGAPIGPVTDEWFLFDSIPEMRYSVDAKAGVGHAQNLQPGKTYYFRYAAQHGDVTCYGETQSVTTFASAHDGLTSR
jgi:hypothetical protein